MNDKFQIFLDENDGTLRLIGREGSREPICFECDNPIPWVLDMMSFKYLNGGYVACHASCVWTKEAFTKQRKRAVA